MDADPWARWRASSGWTDAAPAGPAGGSEWSSGSAPHDFVERFNQAARAYLGAAGGGVAGAADPPKGDAARVFGDALRELFSSLQPPPPFGAAAAKGVGTQAPPTSPAFGLTREHQLRWQRLTAAAGQLDEAQRRLQHLWLDALRDAGAAFIATLARSSPAAGQPRAADATAGEPAATLRRLYDTWIDCAEEAYSRTAHGPAFCDALADAVNAGSRWRQELKALAEESSKLLDLPTRSELNTLQERLRTVEAELHKARKPQPRRPRKK